MFTVQILTTQNLLPFDGNLSLHKHFFSDTKSHQFFKELRENIPWQQHPIKLFGKEILQPRLIAWYGDPKSIYKYSGLTLKPHPWCEPLIEIKQTIELATKQSFNSALLNLYRNEQDSMGAHQDNEKELGKNPVIASISFGETRKITFKHIKEKKLLSFELTNGSLLLMQEQTQTFWKHAIPKCKKPCGTRINITFRQIK